MVLHDHGRSGDDDELGRRSGFGVVELGFQAEQGLRCLVDAANASEFDFRGCPSAVAVPDDQVDFEVVAVAV